MDLTLSLLSLGLDDDELSTQPPTQRPQLRLPKSRSFPFSALPPSAAQPPLTTTPTLSNPGILLRLPPELRIKIYEHVWQGVFVGEKSYLDSSCPGARLRPARYPHRMIHPVRYPYRPPVLDPSHGRNGFREQRKLPAAYGPQARPPGPRRRKGFQPEPLVHRDNINWDTSLTGLLLVSKKLYAESIPYLYHLCNFQLPNPTLGHHFLMCIGSTNALSIRRVELRISLCPTIRRLWSRVVTALPNVDHLCILLQDHLLQTHDDAHRNPEYLKDLVVFSRLKKLKKLIVVRHALQDFTISYVQRARPQHGTRVGYVEIADGEPVRTYMDAAGIPVYENDDGFCLTTKAVRDMIMAEDDIILAQRRVAYLRAATQAAWA
jgi:hypothetical protein